MMIFIGMILGGSAVWIHKIMVGAVASFCLCLIVIGQVRAGGCFFTSRIKIRAEHWLFLGVILGIFCFGIESDQKFQGEKEGRVVGVIEEIGTGKSQYIKINSYKIDDKKQTGALLLYGDPKDLLPGEIVEIKTKIKPYEGRRNPGQFDLKQYYRTRNIFYYGFFEDYKCVKTSYSKYKAILYRLKKQWISTCQSFLSEQEAGVMCSVLLGEKSYMDDTLKQLYQKNGIAHILAISGLHISIIGGTLYRLLKRMGIGFFPSGVISFCMVVPYCMLIGSAVSSLRAVMMLMIFIIGDIKGRSYDFLSSVSLAGIFILLENPYYLLDAGFLLSFTAVFAIGIVVPVFSEGSCGKIIWSSIAIWVTMLPVQAYFFYEISPWSIWLNFLVIPMMPFLLSFGFAGILLKAKWAFVLCHWILTFYEKLLIFPSYVVGQPDIWEIIAYFLLLGMVCQIFRMKKRVYGAAILLIAVLFISIPWESKGFFITFLDVGQGDGIVIHTPKDHTILIDGGSSDVNKVGQYRIQPFLESNGIGKVDVAIITHLDQDHYSGILELLEGGYRIETIVFFEGIQRDDKVFQTISELAKENHSSIVMYSKGNKIEDGGVELDCLFPQRGYDAEKNQQSLTFKLIYEQFSCLLTGDLELQGEEDFLKEKTGKISVLKVGHHGSKNATTDALLDEIRPQYAIISCGIKNSYGHPSKEVIHRLEERGIPTLVTTKTGAVTIEKNGKEFQIIPYLK